MQVDKRSLTTAKGAKDYLSKNEIPQLFECLMTGLMYHRPSDYICYLQDCLERIKKQGMKGVRWDMFLDSKASPLPPINATTKEKSNVSLTNGTPVPPGEDHRPKPLPDIGTLQLRINEDATIVLVQAGPGIDKGDLCRHLCASFPNHVHIGLGSLLRERALAEAEDTESRWRSVQDTINGGDLISEEFVIETLVKELNKHEGRNSFVIEGYPRTTKQREDFEKIIGLSRVKFMLLVDCEEDVCQRNLLARVPASKWKDHKPSAVEKRIFNYIKNTLAVCKYFDDHRKLMVVDGDKSRDLVLKDIHRIFIKEFNEAITPHPPMSPKEPLSPEPPSQNIASPVPETRTEILRLSEISPEEGRNSELPQCQVMLLLGGPGAGKSDVATQICSQHPSWVHVDLHDHLRQKVIGNDEPDQDLAVSNENHPFVENWTISINALKDVIKSVPDSTDIIILEGFPKDSNQLNQFNVEIGRADFAVLLDSEEEAMLARLEERYNRTQKVEDDERYRDLRINHYKENGLPLCRYYDEANKLSVVAGDRDMLCVAEDVEKIVMKRVESLDNSVPTDQSNDPSSLNQLVDDMRAQLAATRIQASIRGHITRKRLSEKASIVQEGAAVVGMDEEIELAIDENLENEERVDSVVEVLETEETEMVTKVDDLVPEEQDSEHQEPEVGEVVEDPSTIENEQLVDKVEKNEDGDHEVQEIVETKEVEDEKDIEEPIVPSTGILLGIDDATINPAMKIKDVVLLIGGPGSGKRTLGNQVANKFDVCFLHVEQMINDAVQSESADSEELRKYLASQECDETAVYSLIRKAIDDSSCKIVLLAGFPKTVEQYRRFDTEVNKVSATIFLDVDDDTLKGRLASTDDSESHSNYESQLAAFKDSSKTLLEELSEDGHFTKVDGTQEVVDVLQQVSDVIENFHLVDGEES